jgi:hypothetical protein
LIVDEGAIAAAQVFDEEVLVPAGDAGVAAGNGRGDDGDVIGLVAADDEGLQMADGEGLAGGGALLLDELVIAPRTHGMLLGEVDRINRIYKIAVFALLVLTFCDRPYRTK